jgi:hypothetical protein
MEMRRRRVDEVGHACEVGESALLVKRGLVLRVAVEDGRDRNGVGCNRDDEGGPFNGADNGPRRGWA